MLCCDYVRASPIEAVYLIVILRPHQGSFVQFMQMTFPKQAYRVFLRRRFGVPIPQIPLRRCTCKPKPELDRLGTHLVCVCPKGRERFVTHDSMALCIRDMAKAAGAYAKFENPDQFRAVNTENGTRTDLLFVGIQE